MAQILHPLLVALLLWWVSTGVILWLVRLPRASFGWSLLLTAPLTILALAGLAVTARQDTALASYLAFGCALTVWGWHEMSFLMGKLTGPRRTACPPEARGWRRFIVSAETLIHHELALFGTALLFVALTWDQPNQTGTLTYLLLLGMRLSTKLNLFLGVPNPPVSLLPESLVYLKSYFRRARFNALLPVSLLLSIVVTGLLGVAALEADGAGDVGYALMFGLAALGLLEHGFLILYSPDQALWGWALGEKQKPALQAVLEPLGKPEQ